MTSKGQSSQGGGALDVNAELDDLLDNIEQEEAVAKEVRIMLLDRWPPCFSIDGGVQVLQISPSGAVFLLDHSADLHVLDIRCQTEQKLPTRRGSSAIDNLDGALQNCAGLILLGNLVVPLAKPMTAVLESDGNLILPHPEAVGYSLAVFLPSAVAACDRHNLVNLIAELSALATSSTDFSTVTWGDRIIQLSAKLCGGVERITDAMPGVSRAVGNRLRQNLSQRTEPVMVDSSTASRLVTLRGATHVVAKTTSIVANAAFNTTVALGKMISGAISDRIPERYKRQASNDKRVAVALDVAASGLSAAAALTVALEKAARAVCKSLADETVLTVGHRYGSAAAKSTENGLYSAGNLISAGVTLRSLGAKRLAKRLARESGKALVGQLDSSVKETRPTLSLSNKPPNNALP